MELPCRMGSAAAGYEGLQLIKWIKGRRELKH